MISAHDIQDRCVRALQEIRLSSFGVTYNANLNRIEVQIQKGDQYDASVVTDALSAIAMDLNAYVTIQEVEFNKPKGLNGKFWDMYLNKQMGTAEVAK